MCAVASLEGALRLSAAEWALTFIRSAVSADSVCRKPLNGTPKLSDDLLMTV